MERYDGRHTANQSEGGHYVQLQVREGGSA
jgi:hypothetical protein